jgi:hypothetical protein
MKPLTKKQIEGMIKAAIKTGHWMLRRSKSGQSCSEKASGFQWQPVGIWTEAPDWDPRPRCGGGLHGNGPDSTGFWTSGRDLDFCVVEDIVKIDVEKIKCRRAMVLLRNKLPANLRVGGSLDLRGTQVKTLPANLRVGGSIYQ